MNFATKQDIRNLDQAIENFHTAYEKWINRLRHFIGVEFVYYRRGVKILAKGLELVDTGNGKKLKAKNLAWYSDEELPNWFFDDYYYFQ